MSTWQPPLRWSGAVCRAADPRIRIGRERPWPRSFGRSLSSIVPRATCFANPCSGTTGFRFARSQMPLESVVKGDATPVFALEILA